MPLPLPLPSHYHTHLPLHRRTTAPPHLPAARALPVTHPRFAPPPAGNSVCRALLLRRSEDTTTTRRHWTRWRRGRLYSAVLPPALPTMAGRWPPATPVAYLLRHYRLPHTHCYRSTLRRPTVGLRTGAFLYVPAYPAPHHCTARLPHRWFPPCAAPALLQRAAQQQTTTTPHPTYHRPTLRGTFCADAVALGVVAAAALPAASGRTVPRGALFLFTAHDMLPFVPIGTWSPHTQFTHCCCHSTLAHTHVAHSPHPPPAPCPPHTCHGHLTFSHYHLLYHLPRDLRTSRRRAAAHAHRAVSALAYTVYAHATFYHTSRALCRPPAFI